MRRIDFRRLPAAAAWKMTAAVIGVLSLTGLAACGDGGTTGQPAETAGQTSAADAGDDAEAEDDAEAGDDAEAIDVAQSVSGLSAAGYTCSSETCTRTEAGVDYTVSLSEDELEAEVRETGSQTALHPHYDTLLRELGQAVEPGRYAGMDWDAIREWANAHADSDDHDTTAGDWTVSARFDDTSGQRARQLVITRS